MRRVLGALRGDERTELYVLFYIASSSTIGTPPTSRTPWSSCDLPEPAQATDLYGAGSLSRLSSAWAFASVALAGCGVPQYTRASRRPPATVAHRRRC